MNETKGGTRTHGGSSGSGPGSDQDRPSGAAPDMTDLARHLGEIAEKSQRMVADFLSRQSGGQGIGMADPMAIGAAVFEMTAKLMADPSRLVQAQLSLWQDYLTLWQRTTQRFFGGEAEPLVAPAVGDRPFPDQAWSDNARFYFIKPSYLLTARSMPCVGPGVAGLD